ncbi:cyclophilin-like fold protein [uncultured Campylobacter sp.]|uniref:cyclophilin-like fold protein n=1 Tax=uncultured Campylobacter sp. TaxID=218934 RepID=UPI002603E0EB|nr:cyclophilin-like fold protein [uncultured Campylobacter sp.]
MRKILAVFMLFAELNLAAGEKMQNLKIVLKTSSGEATAILDDTATARSFAAQPPLTLNLEDYGGRKKVAKLPKRLDTSGSPIGSDGKKGEISYFAPWNNFVIYYGYQPYYEGIVRLGVIDGDVGLVAKDGEIKIEPAK